MKKSVIVIVLMLIVTSISTIFARDKEDGRKYFVAGVAFYNLENLFDTINNNGKYDLEFTPDGARKWDTVKYRSKIHNMARVFTTMPTKTTPVGPAVIGVSEVENLSVLKDLVREVDEMLIADGQRPWNLQIVHQDSPDSRGIDVALLYNPRLFKYVNHKVFPLKIEGRDNFKTRDQLCVTGIIAEDTISVIVNHWPSRLGGQAQSSPLREAAARLSREIALDLWKSSPERGVVIMGDLNDDPQDKSCSKVLGARKNQSSVHFHDFYNPFWTLLDRGIGTLVYDGSWNLFDQIIVSGTLLERNNPHGLYYKSCSVLNFNFLRVQDGDRQGGPLRTYSGVVFLNGFSDHFPTEIFIVKELKND